MWTNNTNSTNTNGGVGPDGLTESERARLRAAVVLHHAYTYQHAWPVGYRLWCDAGGCYNDECPECQQHAQAQTR